jgi:hypothetical protein
MNLSTKQAIIGVLGFLFLLSLVFVQYEEVTRKRAEAGIGEVNVAVPESSRACTECHAQATPGIIDHWKGSTHAQSGVGCVECHSAGDGEPDAFAHYGATIATVVTPLDCSRCHPREFEEFERSHHAAGGNILASLDNFLAETVEGFRGTFDPHGAAPGMQPRPVDGMASAASGCQQCHGSKVALRARDGGRITFEDLRPGPDGKPTNAEAMARIARDAEGRPELHPATWPNTGIGRLNLDGSRGSCSACHSRHDFSPRRARQPENCGKCHLGPDHPQKEIYEESKHGVAYRDLRERMNLDADTWVLGQDYSQAPTCATCHMSGHTRNGGKVTHDPGERISWTNRPPISMLLDTDVNHKVVTETDPLRRTAAIADTWQEKRRRMQDVCAHCHTTGYVEAFYRQYDELVLLYNEKFARPGKEIVDALHAEGLLTKSDFDEEIEWTWFYLWHHEGRRARHGASMMAPDYTHWHGMYEVAERFYVGLIPQALELAEHAREAGNEAGDRVRAVVEAVLARPEHRWFGAASAPVPATSQHASGGEALRRGELSQTKEQ